MLKSVQLPSRTVKNAGYVKFFPDTAIQTSFMSFSKCEQEEVNVGLPDENCCFTLSKEESGLSTCYLELPDPEHTS